MYLNTAELYFDGCLRLFAFYPVEGGFKPKFDTKHFDIEMSGQCCTHVDSAVFMGPFMLLEVNRRSQFHRH
jgi:hypothetical protein